MITKNRKTLLGRVFVAMIACVMLFSALAACDNSTTVAADKTALQTAITSAETIKDANDYGDYTQASRTAFEDALTAAKTVNDNTEATQSEIDDAKTNLVAAQNNLTTAAIDKTALQTAITSAETVKDATDYDDYTQASRTAFEDAFAAAKTVNNNANATQSEIDNAKTNLVAAQNNLTIETVVNVDKTSLQAAIADAEIIKAAIDYEDHTQELRTAFEDTLDAAKTVNDNANATQTEVDDALSSLLAAMALLTDSQSGGEEISNFDEYAGILMIWQVGTAKDGAITRNFIELYNNSNDDIDLSGYSIQYAKATGNNWTMILLEGTIKAHTSFLILGNEGTSLANGRLFFEEGDGDLEADFKIDNDGFKVCLIHSTVLIDVTNPFDIDDEGTVMQGYVDFVGAYNGDTPDAAEGDYAPKMSKQQTARRISLVDTNDNSADFTNIDYRATGTSDDEMQNYRPKNQAYGAWNPVTFESLE